MIQKYRTAVLLTAFAALLALPGTANAQAPAGQSTYPPAGGAIGGRSPTPPPATHAAPFGGAQPGALPTTSRTGSGAATAAGQFANEAQAKSHCPGDTVVWVNLSSKIFHFSGSKDYGTTKRGAYMCEKETASAGVRAAKNEKHP
jgi:hypothetical protein